MDNADIPENNLFPVVNLPIQGETIWPNLMRLLTVGSIVGGIMVSLILMLMIPEEQLRIDPAKLVAILTCLILFELVIVRQLIIPINGDYGRYRVNKDKVELYPLTTLGMGVKAYVENIPMADYKGISITPVIFRDGMSRYYVTLTHPQQSNSIRVKLFNSHVDANAYAYVLAQVLNLKVIKALNIQ